jgi:predicted enzyme related to lactoylglutathione lyase
MLAPSATFADDESLVRRRKEKTMTQDWARPVVAFEIRGQDVAKLREFYQALFNWKSDESAAPIVELSGGIGGPEEITGVMLPGAPGAGFYVQVLDLRTTCDRAAALGGRIVLEPTAVPGDRTIARIADPEGTEIGLLQQ